MKGKNGYCVIVTLTFSKGHQLQFCTSQGISILIDQWEIHVQVQEVSVLPASPTELRAPPHDLLITINVTTGSDGTPEMYELRHFPFTTVPDVWPRGKDKVIRKTFGGITWDVMWPVSCSMIGEILVRPCVGDFWDLCWAFLTIRHCDIHHNYVVLLVSCDRDNEYLYSIIAVLK